MLDTFFSFGTEFIFRYYPKMLTSKTLAKLLEQEVKRLQIRALLTEAGVAIHLFDRVSDCDLQVNPDRIRSVKDTLKNHKATLESIRIDGNQSTDKDFVRLFAKLDLYAKEFRSDLRACPEGTDSKIWYSEFEDFYCLKLNYLHERLERSSLNRSLRDTICEAINTRPSSDPDDMHEYVIRLEDLLYVGRLFMRYREEDLRKELEKLFDHIAELQQVLARRNDPGSLFLGSDSENEGDFKQVGLYKKKALESYGAGCKLQSDQDLSGAYEKCIEALYLLAEGFNVQSA